MSHLQSGKSFATDLEFTVAKKSVTVINGAVPALNLASGIRLQGAIEKIKSKDLTYDELIHFSAELLARLDHAGDLVVQANGKVQVLTTLLGKVAESRGVERKTVEIINKFASIISIGDQLFHDTLDLAQEMPEIVSQAQQEGDKVRRSAVAKKGAHGKLRKDPLQADKRYVYGRWLEWQSDKSAYEGPTAFADDILDNSAEIKKVQERKQILDWHYDWKNGRNLPSAADDQ